MPGEGDMVGKYELGEELGAGGMAVVYKASNVESGETVALKLLSQHRGEDEVDLVRFMRESQVNIPHRNIVPVLDAGHSDHGMYIVMPLIKGSNLKEAIPKGGMEPFEAIELLTPIADALDFANSRGHIHRDVKPENILLAEDRTAYLTDFGVAKSIGDRPITRTGRGVGTLGYVSPEQEDGRRLSRKADIYSFAAVLFECLTGAVPIPTAKRTRWRGWRRSRLPFATEKNPRLRAEIDPVLRRGLARYPWRRPRTATQLVGEAGRALKPAQPPILLPKWQLGVAGLALLGIGVWLGLITAPQSPPRDWILASAAGVRLQVPPGWQRSLKPSETLGEGMFDPVHFVAPRKSAGPIAIVAGMTKAEGPSLLPDELRLRLGARVIGARQSLGLGALSAYRYAGSIAGDRWPVVVFVAPTSSGVVTLGCRLRESPPARSAVALCDRIASTLTPRGGIPFELGPTTELAEFLRERLPDLRERRQVALKRLRGANGGDNQAAAAIELAEIYNDATGPLARVPVSPESAPTKRGLMRSLIDAYFAYRALGHAARLEDAASYRRAEKQVARADEEMGTRLRILARIGYEI